MTPADPPPDVLRLLDELPAPAVRPVDLPAVYAAAAELHARRLRRWKRLAGAAAAVAAGVFAAAVLPKLEVRAGNGEFAVRWGDPPAPPAAQASVRDADGERQARRDAQLALALARLDRLEADARRAEELAAAQAELKDLLLVVAADLDRLDESQKGSAEQQRTLAAWVAARLTDVDGKLADVRKDNTAIYTLITDRK